MRHLLFVQDSFLHPLQMYQVKIGNITTNIWRNEIKPQLEEIFEIEPPKAIIDKGKISCKVGILVFNGYIKNIVEPKMTGWQKIKKNKDLNISFWI